MMKKYTIVCILIALAILAGVFSFVQKQSVVESPKEPAVVLSGEAPSQLSFPGNTLDTSDWQTYRSEEFGFEVKYPKDVVTVSGKRAVEMKGMYEFGFYLDWNLGRVDIEPLSKKYGLRIYVYDKNVDTMFKLYSALNKAPYDIIGNIPVNNTKFFFLTPRVDTQAWNLSRYQSVYFSGDVEHAYEIVLAEIPSGQEKTFQKILSTFKIIE